MTTTAALLVIQHEDACPQAWFGPWLREAGLELTIVAAHRGDEVPRTCDGHQGLLVLGGEMGANDDATVPWLETTRSLLAAAVRDGVPTLGVCLGHQLLAAALGGTVTRNPHGMAKGLTPVTLTPDGHADALLAGFGGTRTIQWNRDIATRLPDGATALATAPDGTVQAARFGPRAWGVQFHPEASPAVFRTWTTDKDLPDGVRAKLEPIAAEVDAAEVELRATWQPLAARFAEVVRGATGIALEIRDAVPADLPRLREVFRRSALVHDDQRAVLLAHPEVLELDAEAVLTGDTRVAVVDGDVVGFATMTGRAGDAVGELVDLFVDPEHLRRGIGRALVEDLVDRARTGSLTRLEVTANDQALAFYDAAGFVRVGTARTRFGPAPRMQRHL